MSRSPYPAVKAIRAAGLDVTLDGDDLLVGPSASITPELAGLIREYKPELVDWYRNGATAEGLLYSGPYAQRPEGWNSTISSSASELTDEQLVAVRERITDAIEAKAAWVILFAGLVGETSLAMVEDMVGDGLRVQVLRLPDDLGFWVALVPKAELNDMDLQARVRAHWGWDVDLDQESDVVAFADNNALTEALPQLQSTLGQVFGRLLGIWLKTGKIVHLEPLTEADMRELVVRVADTVYDHTFTVRDIGSGLVLAVYSDLKTALLRARASLDQGRMARLEVHHPQTCHCKAVA